jgi:hypothetical protein
MKQRLRAGLGLALALGALAPPMAARAAPFDLTGPVLEISVTRGGKTLPVSEVPSLQPGDQLSITADLPPGESVHYLLVTAFLRGATNPPPENWFFRTAAWKAKSPMKVAVPQGAEEALVFLAPQTGGDFRTLMGAVRARPGAFVRAAQELGQASLDRSRLDVFTEHVNRLGQTDPGQLQTVTPLLARSLGVKIDASCLKKVSDTQASCLTQDRDALVLDDAGRTSKLEQLASGYSAEIVRDLSSAPWAGAGNFSPYVASLIDIVHLFDASRTAQYQYIPALGVASGRKFSLLLNAPPSFRNPQSVLVAALPQVQAVEPPKLHAIDADAVYCAGRPDVVVPMDGAPLLYSTGFAHDLAVRLDSKAGPLDLPAKADPERGGLVVDASAALGRRDLSPEGRLVGDWGFVPFEDGKLKFAVAQPQAWGAKGGARPSLVVGQESTLELVGQASACVESVRLQAPGGAETPLTWSTAGPDGLSIHLPPKPAGAGDFKLLIHAYGLKAPDVVPLGLYSKPAQVAGFAYHVGDRTGVLTGERLDEVKAVVLEGANFAASGAGPASDTELELTVAESDAPVLQHLSAGDLVSGQAQLKDGRTVAFRTTVQPPRPLVSVISRDVEIEPATGLSIRLGDKQDVPRRAKLTFSIRAEPPAVFTGRESLEVATANGVFSANLSAADGLVLQDSQVAVASLDLQKKFSASAYGQLRFRVVKDNVPSDWQPLATLVRLPQVTGVSCGEGREAPCTLKGSNLFLIAEIAGSAKFEKSVTVPDGFAAESLSVPHPRGGRLYLKLRDDPQTVDTLVVSPESASGRRGEAHADAAPVG